MSRHLWLGGLAPGADRGTLINVAQAFGPLQDVTMIDGTPVALVSFASVQPACRAFELLDGQQVSSSRKQFESLDYVCSIEHRQMLKSIFQMCSRINCDSGRGSTMC